jgi:hypothetical protein
MVPSLFSLGHLPYDFVFQPNAEVVLLRASELSGLISALLSTKQVWVGISNEKIN